MVGPQPDRPSAARALPSARPMASRANGAQGVRGTWLREYAARAEDHLRSLPEGAVSPAGRILLEALDHRRSSDRTKSER